jgi:hypothetical protein
MKGIIVVLALFAVAKISVTEYFFRTSAREVIVAAYRDRALAACRSDSRAAPVASGTWEKTADVRLVIGKSDLDVQLWQFDHQLWDARFRNPYIVLTAGDKSGTLVCEFDVVHNAALIYRL